MTVSNVAPLETTNLADVPALLRHLADQIEEGEYGKVHTTAVVLEAEEFPVFGFGASAHPQNVSELFACAHQKLVLMRLQSSED